MTPGRLARHGVAGNNALELLLRFCGVEPCSSRLVRERESRLSYTGAESMQDNRCPNCQNDISDTVTSTTSS